GRILTNCEVYCLEQPSQTVHVKNRDTFPPLQVKILSVGFTVVGSYTMAPRGGSILPSVYTTPSNRARGSIWPRQNAPSLRHRLKIMQTKHANWRGVAGSPHTFPLHSSCDPHRHEFWCNAEGMQKSVLGIFSLVLYLISRRSLRASAFGEPIFLVPRPSGRL